MLPWIGAQSRVIVKGVEPFRLIATKKIVVDK